MGLTKTLFGGSDSKTNPAFIDKTQQPFLKDIYGQAQGLFGNTAGQDYSSQFLQPSAGAFNTLATGGMTIPGLTQGLQNFGGQQDVALGGAIDAGINDINRNFSQNIMPEINQGAALSGTPGGSRQGIAQGIAAGEANRNVSDFVNRMRSGNFETTAKNKLGAYRNLTDIQGQGNQAINAALTSAPNISNLGFGNQWGNLKSYADIIGRPTVMSGGGTSSSQTGMFAPMQLSSKPLFG